MSTAGLSFLQAYDSDSSNDDSTTNADTSAPSTSAAAASASASAEFRFEKIDPSLSLVSSISIDPAPVVAYSVN